MIETFARHVLAGFHCVDAITKSSILHPLKVTAKPLEIRRNRSGVFAVVDAPGLRSYTQSLTPASWPATASTYEITIHDPSLTYLPRRANIQVPQPLPPVVIPGATTTAAPTTTAAQGTTSTTTAAPTTTVQGLTSTTPAPTTTVEGVTSTTTAAPATTPAVTTTAPVTTPAPTTTAQAGPPPLPPITKPQRVVLYPGPAAPLAPNWAVVRAYVVSSDTPAKALPWAVVQVAIPGKKPLTGVTNKNGEALLAAHGLGLTFSADSTGAVTETTTPATVTAWFDPATRPPGWISNPDDILLALSSTQWKQSSPQAVQLEPRRTVFVTLTISM